jgi:hypothetical protein
VQAACVCPKRIAGAHGTFIIEVEMVNSFGSVDASTAFFTMCVAPERTCECKKEHARQKFAPTVLFYH